MRKYILLFLFTICLGRITAQTFFSKTTPDLGTSPKAAVDTLKILAVMVDFQTDKDDATFGNGKFGSIYTKTYGQSILDPLPHDESYFSLHLDFAANYFRKVSNGKLNIAYKILPGVTTVSKTMRSYSPPGGSSQDYTLLGNLAKEVWTAVREKNPDINFSQYDVFTIFHAGVGRDISLPGSFGNEKDLPSLYMGDKTLRNIFQSDLTGLPVNRFGQLNTMFIPETESREMTDITGAPNLIQISINGLIAANLGSHLGLPDLYDTKTGLSAIGRFGLMDGQSIFTYSGTFPPEPSPWEKIYMGWLSPVEVQLTPELTGAGQSISLTALRAASGNDTTVIKVPISSTEYYLVENRNRDALKNGAAVTYIAGSDKFTKVFPKDTTGFYSYSVDSLRGVITDVDEFDWALPGSGIVIWHIDENVINSKISANQINTDKFNRGVDIEEADGVQDIGEKFTTVFGDEVVGEGTAEDFWFKTNTSKLYKNEFSFNTVPPARTNSGANSNLDFLNFSDISNKMSFSLIKRGAVTPVAEKKLAVSDTISYLTASGNTSANYFYALSKKNLYSFDINGNIIDTVNNFSLTKPAVLSQNNNESVYGTFQNNLNFFITSGNSKVKASATSKYNLTSPAVIRKTASGFYEILAGTSNGRILHYTTGSVAIAPILSNMDIFDSTLAVRQILADSLNYFALASNNANTTYVIDEQRNSVSVEGYILQSALLRDLSGNTSIVLLSSDNKFYVISAGKVQSSFSVKSENQVSSFSLADLKQNGQLYILFSNGNQLEARNLNGAAAENFPVEDPKSIGFEGSPLFVSGYPQSQSVILTYTKDGRVFEFTGDGKLISGFPLTAGSSISAPVVFNLTNNPNNSGNLSLAVVTKSNYFYGWNLSSGNISSAYPFQSWLEEYGNSLNSASLVQKSTGSASGLSFFPKERVYNWPNPVYGSETNIRYYVSEDSKINIKIFDLAGGFVAELNSDARGGSDNETVWNVTDIQSGVYLARVEASGVSGKKENSIIKIAVIK